MSEAAAEQPVTRVECPASNDLFMRRIIVAVLILGGAVWIFVDPSENGHNWKAGDINNNGYYLYNYCLPYLLAGAGLLLLGRALLDHSRRLGADEQGIGFAGKEQIAWGRLTRVDATLLVSKGLLILHYQDGPAGQGGQDQGEKALKLDSYSFRNFRDMVALIERQVPAEKIQR